MIKLDDHVVEIDGVKYIPYEIAAKAYSEIYDYEKNQTKFDSAMKLIENSIRGISGVMDNTTKDIDG
jgi:hypothetical protein